jgi:hypothetical protein
MSSTDMSRHGLLMPILNLLLLWRVSNRLPLVCLNSKKYDTRRLNHIGGSPGEPESAWVRVLNQRW